MCCLRAGHRYHSRENGTGEMFFGFCSSTSTKLLDTLCIYFRNVPITRDMLHCTRYDSSYDSVEIIFLSNNMFVI